MRVVEKKINNKDIIVLIILLVFSIILLMQSPLNPLVNKISGTDSSVFRYGANILKNDKTIYKDSFDHKGPMIYFIDYIGNQINSNSGIWILEIVSICMSMFFSYKTVNLVYSKKSSLISTISTYLLLTLYFEQGNLTEEWALPFISISLYIFIKYIVSGSINNFYIILCGACFAIVTMLRINMIVIWGVFALIILIINIRNKTYVSLFKQIFWFSLGSSIIFIPIIIYLLKNDAIVDFMNQYIKFNLQYQKATFSEKIDSLIYFSNNPIIYISFISLIYMYKNGKIRKELVLGIGISEIGSLLAIAMAGRLYMHYGMILIPVLSVLVATVIETISTLNDKKIEKYILMYIVLTVILVPNAIKLYKNIKDIRNLDDTYVRYIAETVKENTEDSDMITVLGNSDIVYILSDRMSVSKYSYQFPISNVNPHIFEEYMRDIKNGRPKAIVINYQIDDIFLCRINEYLNSENYKKIEDGAIKIYLSE